MGIYVNPGNKGFQKALQSEYVDKTGLIALINQNIDTTGMLTCISRPWFPVSYLGFQGSNYSGSRQVCGIHRFYGT